MMRRGGCCWMRLAACGLPCVRGGLWFVWGAVAGAVGLLPPPRPSPTGEGAEWYATFGGGLWFVWDAVAGADGLLPPPRVPTKNASAFFVGSPRPSPTGEGAEWYATFGGGLWFVWGVVAGAVGLLPPHRPSPTGEGVEWFATFGGSLWFVWGAVAGAVGLLPPPQPFLALRASCPSPTGEGDEWYATFGDGLWFVRVAVADAAGLLPPPRPSPTGEGAVWWMSAGRSPSWGGVGW